ncbi:MAG: pyridoxamine 5'-phosphate oxidase family protein [Nitrosopumilus sp.]|nr:pyridoxamine 5'-phosphate oxidase family protein [Nitrosopumilus sp.]MDH3515447.1 pyridoxamine 5'-phosphate oxidase family protein [Nitrosopumilus sp.]MDH3564252.1 pyridoxamine 5'-phosphate oxidase family protein [Nitrosopumilus sp.]MDH5416599.1 pyridoxamine 5'-phosphate oxidase family protein [Nitrosopumilus sp.]MDH5555134.1 pyridoxamine 5'-phosphate oxidase family protein [Nitrosopumilus sp.]
MVKIPDKIKEFIENQGIFAVGTVSGNKFPNVSPRIFFTVDEDAIYWLDFFKHKSYRNFQINPWVTVSVFNKDELEGYQFRGVVRFITDEPIKSEIKESIIKKTLKSNPSPKVKLLSEKEANVVEFEVKVCYSLNPEKHSDLSISSDINPSQLF